MRTLPPPRMTTAEIMTFLRTSPQPYCAACVALTVGGNLEETRSLLSGLHNQGVVQVGTRACHGCGRTVETFMRRIGARRRTT
jgi:hypothetical protein